MLLQHCVQLLSLLQQLLWLLSVHAAAAGGGRSFCNDL
jgi:hypothetical protein